MTCPFCDGELVLDVHEIWGRDFMLETCCIGLHEAWVEDLNCPVLGEQALAEITELVAGYVPARKVYASESEWAIQIDYQLRVGDIPRPVAKDFVREHHRHNPPPAGDRFRFGCWNGPDLIAVAIVGRPVARMIDHTKVVEVNRLCVNHELDRELTHKACSMLYRAAAEEARARGFEKIITYTLESERGMSLRYARWKVDGHTKGGSWDRPSRPRTDKAPTCRKVRWAKSLNGRRP